MGEEPTRGKILKDMDVHTPEIGKHTVLLVGQTPPPWHGQAVATKILFDHDWPEYEVPRLRLDYSDDLDDVGRFQFKKLYRLYRLIIATRELLSSSKGSILFYPPASARWIPFIRDVFFLILVRGKASKTVFIFHASGLADFTRRNPMTRWLADLAYGNADMALEVAEEKVSPHETFESKAFQWCPCGIEAPAMVRHPREPGTAVEILFVGSLQEGKGILEILKTAEILLRSPLQKNFHIRIVGRWMDTEFKRRALAMHANFGLQDVVTFPGQLTGNAKWDSYRDSDIFFFPSHYHSEASPLVLMEALAAGLPVVTTAWNGIPALMKGCPTAILLPVKSPDLFAEAIVRLAGDDAKRERAASASRKFYDDNFRPECFVERVSGALKVVADSLPPRRSDAGADNGGNSGGKLNLAVYLADQNPGYDRSMGISRMSEVVLGTMAKQDDLSLHIVSSRTSQQGPSEGATLQILPWSTRSKLARVVTDHLHPVLSWLRSPADVWYFPKGFLPRFGLINAPVVVTVHDTIIQHYWDNYPGWRKSSEYSYWAQMLKSTLTQADGIFTVSENSKQQILAFMDRHGIAEKEILVTYEPCIYEKFPQPTEVTKEDYAVHLASREPHKRTEDLIRWWAGEAERHSALPQLHLIGLAPEAVSTMVRENGIFIELPFLSDESLRDVVSHAKALILPSEIEGFGLPAIEAYYLGTPVCFNLGTSIEEILSDATSAGGFTLDDMDSLRNALKEVLAMRSDEIHHIGMNLRKRYASERIVGRMVDGFRKVAESGGF